MILMFFFAGELTNGVKCCAWLCFPNLAQANVLVKGSISNNDVFCIAARLKFMARNVLFPGSGAPSKD